jgi:hypothetical protein
MTNFLPLVYLPFIITHIPLIKSQEKFITRRSQWSHCNASIHPYSVPPAGLTEIMQLCREHSCVAGHLQLVSQVVPVQPFLKVCEQFYKNYSELLSFWNLSIVRYSKKLEYSKKTREH